MASKQSPTTASEKIQNQAKKRNQIFDKLSKATNIAFKDCRDRNWTVGRFRELRYDQRLLVLINLNPDTANDFDGTEVTTHTDTPNPILVPPVITFSRGNRASPDSTGSTSDSSETSNDETSVTPHEANEPSTTDNSTETVSIPAAARNMRTAPQTNNEITETLVAENFAPDETSDYKNGTSVEFSTSNTSSLSEEISENISRSETVETVEGSVSQEHDNETTLLKVSPSGDEQSFLDAVFNGLEEAAEMKSPLTTAPGETSDTETDAGKQTLKEPSEGSTHILVDEDEGVGTLMDDIANSTIFEQSNLSESNSEMNREEEIMEETCSADDVERSDDDFRNEQENGLCESVDAKAVGDNRENVDEPADEEVKKENRLVSHLENASSVTPEIDKGLVKQETYESEMNPELPEARIQEIFVTPHFINGSENLGIVSEVTYEVPSVSMEITVETSENDLESRNESTSSNRCSSSSPEKTSEQPLQDRYSGTRLVENGIHEHIDSPNRINETTTTAKDILPETENEEHSSGSEQREQIISHNTTVFDDEDFLDTADFRDEIRNTERPPSTVITLETPTISTRPIASHFVRESSQITSGPLHYHEEPAQAHTPEDELMEVTNEDGEEEEVEKHELNDDELTIENGETRMKMTETIRTSEKNGRIEHLRERTSRPGWNEPSTSAVYISDNVCYDEYHEVRQNIDRSSVHVHQLESTGRLTNVRGFTGIHEPVWNEPSTSSAYYGNYGTDEQEDHRSVGEYLRAVNQCENMERAFNKIIPHHQSTLPRVQEHNGLYGEREDWREVFRNSKDPMEPIGNYLKRTRYGQPRTSSANYVNNAVSKWQQVNGRISDGNFRRDNARRDGQECFQEYSPESDPREPSTSSTIHDDYEGEVDNHKFESGAMSVNQNMSGEQPAKKYQKFVVEIRKEHHYTRAKTAELGLVPEGPMEKKKVKHVRPTYTLEEAHAIRQGLSDAVARAREELPKIGPVDYTLPKNIQDMLDNEHGNATLDRLERFNLVPRRRKLNGRQTNDGPPKKKIRVSGNKNNEKDEK